MTALALVPDETPTLAQQINDEYEKAETAWKTAVRHAVRCGELLYEVKLQLDSGYQTWVDENFAGSRSTAEKYRQCAQAVREHPELRERLDDFESLKAFQRFIKPPTSKPRPTPIVEHVDPTIETHRLTIDQLAEMIASFGGNATPDRIRRWIERLTEPKIGTCPNCNQPILRAIVKDQEILASPYEWQPRTTCTKCLQTRHAHPGRPVSCPHCNNTGYTGTTHRPPGPMLAMDMAWSDTPNLRIIGPHTDRREGEALHPLHQCAQEQAA